MKVGRSIGMFWFVLGSLLFSPQLAHAQSSNDSSGSSAGTIAAGIFCCGVPILIMIAVIIFMNNNRKPYVTGTQTSLPIDQSLQMAVQVYTLAGFQVTSHTQQNVTFTKQTRPNMGFVILLLITGILPGIIYWVLANKPYSVNIVALERANVTAVNITSSATGFGGKTTADKLVQTLPIGGSGFAPPTSQPQLPATNA